MNIPVHLITWLPCWRIIPAVFPDPCVRALADPADLEAMYELESLTNDRLRGRSRRVAARALAGPYFRAWKQLYYGSLHASESCRKPVQRWHLWKLLTPPPPSIQPLLKHGITESSSWADLSVLLELDMRVRPADLHQQLHDIRGRQQELPAVYALDDYSAAQALGKRLRAQNSWGIAYDSVRHHSGECAAVFRPPALNNCRQERYLCYVWDGTRISRMYRKSSRRHIPYTCASRAHGLGPISAHRDMPTAALHSACWSVVREGHVASAP